jgi:hypothetical protein
MLFALRCEVTVEELVKGFAARTLLGLLCFASPMLASATETYCGVTQHTPDGFVAIREGPGVGFPMRGKAIPSDFLYVGTEKCRDEFGALVCSPDASWVFVEEVAGSKLKGWARGSLIRTVTCPGD